MNLTFFELNDKTIKNMKFIFRWALKNAESKQSAKISAKDEYGMQQLGPNEDLDYEAMEVLIDEESINTFGIELKDTPYGKRLIITLDVFKDGNTYMVHFGLIEDFFDMLERQDIIRKCRSYDDFKGYT